ncbi:hypothetical protein ACHQM5_029518 [Ranunculus cassubicifolius]
MAFLCVSTLSPTSPIVISSTSKFGSQSFIASSSPLIISRKGLSFRGNKQVVCMAPDEEKMTRRSPLDFPIEWERPRPGRRPDIFPQFSPMKTPLPPPSPADPPEEDEEEEEKKEEEEDEEDPDKENPDEQDK